MGYTWTPKIRITPTDGAVTTLALNTAFAWVGGPVKVELQYKPDMVSRRDVNQKECPWVRGFRVEVGLVFEIGDTMADHAYLAQILNALADGTSVVELTLDDVTWREVVLREFKGPSPIGGKTVAGAKYELGLTVADLVTEILPISTGRW